MRCLLAIWGSWQGRAPSLAHLGVFMAPSGAVANALAKAAQRAARLAEKDAGLGGPSPSTTSEQSSVPKPSDKALEKAKEKSRRDVVLL